MRLITLFLLIFFLSFAYTSGANATSFERLVMPGELIQGHAKYEDNCSECHESFSKTDQSKLCMSCHKDIALDVKKQKGFHGKSKIANNRKCDSCHTDHKGRDANIVLMDTETFNHKLTDFPLSGKHAQTKCTSCHKANKKYSEAPSNCYSCHKEDDTHKEKLGKKCYRCHSSTSWNQIKFDHSKTDFKLRGKHRETSCDSCHPDNRHKKTAKKCYSCHAINDAHKGRYGNKCQTCHSEKKWSETHFDHNVKTKFKLRGEHKNITCDSCHTHKTGTIFKQRLKKSCISCHKNDDVHNGQNGNKCQKCHSEKRWSQNKFNHNKDTKFKLRGLHKKLSCATCHPAGKKNKKKKIKVNCYSCHKLDDSHRGQQGKECNSCHNDLGWKHKVRFNHDLSGFPLLGQHAISPCEECHLDSAFKDASSNCISCHKTDDTHKQTLGTSCNRCHNPNGWKLWQFDHDRQTQFKLEDSHKDLNCKSCHKNTMNDSIEQSPTCNVCHLQDDIHRGDFGNHCDQCHNSVKFDQIQLSN
jgi:hypothetical protein